MATKFLVLSPNIDAYEKSIRLIDENSKIEMTLPKELLIITGFLSEKTKQDLINLGNKLKRDDNFELDSPIKKE